MRFLLIKLRFIGDNLLVLPAAKAIKQSFKKSYVSMLVNSGTEEILYGNPYIDRIYTFNRIEGLYGWLSLVSKIRREKFNVSIDFTCSDRAAFFSYMSGAKRRLGFHSGSFLRDNLLYTQSISLPTVKMHQIEKNLFLLKSFGINWKIERPEIFLDKNEIERAREILIHEGWDGATPYVVFHPGARRWFKSWPPEYFSMLGDLIKSQFQVEIVLCGGKEDIKTAMDIQKGMRNGSINTAGKTSIRELASIIKCASLFIGNDSAPMHIAYSLDVPTIALFGPTDWESWHPVGQKHTFISKDVPCRPCGHSKDCDKGEMNCMRLIKVEEVFEKVCYFLR